MNGAQGLVRPRPPRYNNPVLRPILLSGRTRLGGLMVFVSVLGGIAAFGMIGLILGPIVFAMALAVLDVYTRPSRPA